MQKASTVHRKRFLSRSSFPPLFLLQEGSSEGWLWEMRGALGGRWVRPKWTKSRNPMSSILRHYHQLHVGSSMRSTHNLLKDIKIAFQATNDLLQQQNRIPTNPFACDLFLSATICVQVYLSYIWKNNTCRLKPLSSFLMWA